MEREGRDFVWVARWMFTNTSVWDELWQPVSQQGRSTEQNGWHHQRSEIYILQRKHTWCSTKPGLTLENQRQMWGFCPPKEPEGSCSTSILMLPSCSSLWKLRQRSNVAHSMVFFNMNTERLVGIWFKKKNSLYKKSANVNKQSLYTFNLKI